MTDLAVGGGGPKAQKPFVVSLAASGVIVQGTPGKRIKVSRWSAQARADATTFQITDGPAGTNLTHVWTFNAREGVQAPATIPNNYHFATSPGNSLYGVTNGAGVVDVDGMMWDTDGA